MSKLLYTGTEWDLDLIGKMWNVINDIATSKYNLSYAEPQIEVVSADQMLYYHSIHALPVMYKHWSFGKQYAEASKSYKTGRSGLAYETILNTDPMITYIAENNTATMQATVLAHAVCGHGSFFKNNYLFKEWTDPESIVDYLLFAKRFVEKCEEKYGESVVEKFLDGAHALWLYGIDKYKRPRKEKDSILDEKRKAWQRFEDETTDAFWDDMFLPTTREFDLDVVQDWPYPEENLLYFMEKNSPHMPQWKRELLRIVRKTAQYFYPQIQTKLMNEGWATFWHYTLMNDLYEEGYIDEGSFIEFLSSHAGVTALPRDVQLGRSINPYALGSRIFLDLRRACEDPTPEDYKTLPMVAGQEWLPTLQEVMESFKDQNFILEFLGPQVISELGLFCIEDDQEKASYEVLAVQDTDTYREIRKYLSQAYDFDKLLPQIEVAGFNPRKDRTLILRYTALNGQRLDGPLLHTMNKHVRKIWGYPIELHQVHPDGSLIGKTRRTFD